MGVVGTFRFCDPLSRRVQPPDAENRMSGGVGGLTGAIPSARPDHLTLSCSVLTISVKINLSYQFNGIVMPTISMFYGILVSMFFEEGERHHLPHIHVRYQGFKASIAIDDGRILAGQFPPKQLKLVQAWVEIHRDDLFADWELAVSGEALFRIAPLQ